MFPSHPTSNIINIHTITSNVWDYSEGEENVAPHLMRRVLHIHSIRLLLPFSSLGIVNVHMKSGYKCSFTFWQHISSNLCFCDPLEICT